MERFPDEFDVLLSRSGLRRLMALDRSASGGRKRKADYFTRVTDIIAPSRASAALRLLERTLFPVMTPLSVPIPPDSIWAMREPYTERLSKTSRCRTASLFNPRSRSHRKAKDVGLLQMLHSASLKRLAEGLSGRALCDERDVQLLCYEHGDYMGPHNDHHPNVETAKDGFVDLQVSLCNGFVDHQWLVYERDGFLDEIVRVSDRSSVTCYRLPFWHYTTPLQARPGRQAQARRWILIASFRFA